MVRGGRFQFHECSAKNSKILRPSFNSRRLYLNTTLQHNIQASQPAVSSTTQPSRPMRTQLLMAAASAACASAFLLPLSSPQQRAPLLQRRAASTRMMVASAPAASTAAAAAPSLMHQLQADYPRVPIPPDFLDGVPPSDSGAGADGGSSSSSSSNSGEAERLMVRARTFASLAPRALLARGLDIISEDFTFFSPSTGRLSRAEYMGLVSLLERALPDLRLAATHFHVASSAGGGAVSFVSRAQGTFSGELSMGDLVVPGSGALYKGDVELNVVAFDQEGLLQSLSTGLVVPEAAVAADAELQEALLGIAHTGAGVGEEAGEGDAEMVDMKRRLESQVAKLKTTPEGTNAWEKIAADIATMQKKVDAFQRDSALVRTSGGHGGLGGILFALGVETQGPLVSLDGVLLPAGEDFDGAGMELGGMSLPIECETMVAQPDSQWEHLMSS